MAEYRHGNLLFTALLNYIPIHLQISILSAIGDAIPFAIPSIHLEIASARQRAPIHKRY
jgi:hypothetical protein